MCIRRDWLLGTLRSVLRSLRLAVGVRKERSTVGALGILQDSVDDLQNTQVWV